MENVRRIHCGRLFRALPCTGLLFMGLLFMGLLRVPSPVGAQPLPGLPQEQAEEEVPGILPVEPVPDSLLAQRLRTVFGTIDEFEGVEVAVENGVVRLSGTVLQARASEQAAALAERFEGVLFVDNDIEAETDVETRITPALRKVQDYVNQVVQLLPLFGIAFVIVLLFWMFGALLGRWEAPARRLGISPLVWSLVRRLLRAIVVLLGFLLAFDILGVTALVGAVLGTAGVLGLAIGFAFQDIIENYLAGALLSIRQPFRVNDLVRIGEHEGRVVRLTARELVLLSLEGNHIQLPNATVFQSTLVNYTRNPRRLFSFDAGIGTEEDLVRAMELGTATLQEMKGILDDPPPFARVERLGDSSVTVRFHGWVHQDEADFLKVRSEAVRLVKAALDEAGIEMPEPIYRVRLRRLHEGEETAPPKPEVPSVHEQARDIDVAPDREIDDQVREELAASGEENFLRDSGNPDRP